MLSAAPLALRPYQCDALTAIEAATLRGVRHVCEMVLLEGTLRKRQKREGQWELFVSGFALLPLLAPPLTGSSN